MDISKIVSSFFFTIPCSEFMRFKKDYPCSGFLQKLPDPSIKHYRMYSHGLIREIKITLPRS